MLVPFRVVTRGRWRRSRAMAVCLGAAALTLYALTVPNTAFPGTSASWIAWVSGLDAYEVPVRPFLLRLGGWVAAWPYGSLALRLNLLAAVAGALTVGWVYRLVWFTVFESMREESAVVWASRTARLGGFVAALAVGLSLPFWQAATRFSPEIFDAALIAGCAHLLVVYARSRNGVWLALFSVVGGLAAVESPAFLVAAPILVAAAFFVEWKEAWCRLGRLVGYGFLAFFLFVSAHVFFVNDFLAAQGHPATGRALLSTLVSVFRQQIDAMTGFLPQTLWAPMLVLGLGTTLLSFFASVRILNNVRTWGLLVLSLFLSLSISLMAFNAPFTPWALLSTEGVMPATTYLFFGMGAGLLVAAWRAFAVLKDPLTVDIPPEEDDDDEENPPPVVFAASRTAGFLLAPALAVLLMASGLFNGVRLRADSGAFADRAADTVLDDLKGRSWLVGNGVIDTHILIRAHERGLAVHLLCPYRAREPVYVARVLNEVMKDPGFSEAVKLRAQSLIAYNFHLFIDDLFASDSTLPRHVVCMGLPDLWYGSGWLPLPEQLFYGGVKAVEPPDVQELLARHRILWKKWDAFLKKEGRPTQLSYRYRQALRRHLAFVANNLGVVLEDAGALNDAFEVFQAVHSAVPENISALLNLFDLVSRGIHPELKDRLAGELRNKVQNPKDRYPLWALSRYYGYVRNYELFVQMGWSWAMSSCPGSVLAGLRSVYAVQHDDDRRASLVAMMASVYEMRGDVARSQAEYKNVLAQDPKNTFAISGLVRLALQENAVAGAESVLQAGELAGVSRRLLRQDWAAVYLVSGDLPRARVLLQELGDEANASPMALAMLAMVMVEQQDVSAVETTVLPRLIKIAGKSEAYFVQVVQGRVWQSKGKTGYRNARLCYQRAAALRPDVQALLDVILVMDVGLEDQKAAEAHALAILRQRPSHAYANFIMGSIRLEQGLYGDAEAYLRRSVSTAEPMVAALNNYAQVLCRIRKVEEAETVARRATGVAPKRYEAWSTLAFVLAHEDRLTEASEALRRARDLNADDHRLFLTDGWIAAKQGDRPRAEKAVAEVALVPSLSVDDRRELANLSDAIARLPK